MLRLVTASLYVCVLALFGTSPAFADTVTCTANSGNWRWANGAGSLLNLTTIPAGFTTSYLDALRDTENFGVGTDPETSSRAGLDATMPERFTTGPQPWGVTYSDKRLVFLTNFSPSDGYVLPDPSPATGNCVPAGSTINSVTAHVTHAFIDPKDDTSSYAARIRVLDGLGVWQAFNLANLAVDGGIAGEVEEDVNVFSVLNTATLVNGANIQFQAMRSGEANRAILNEISLFVDYTCESCGGGQSTERALVTGGGYITYGSRVKQNANFGFNARATDSAASGVLQYNDGNYTLQGRVTSITCTPYGGGNAGGTATFGGTYMASTPNGKKTFTGTFTTYVEDNGEPGKGADKFRLTATGGVNIETTLQLLTGGNIQFHFCE